MPQSLITTPGGAGQALEVSGRSLVGAHAQIANILKSRLGQNHGDLLAQPRLLPEGGIAWSTPLEGTVQPGSRLAPDERAKLQQRADRLSGEIRGLARQMEAEGPAAQVVAQMLERVLMQAPGDWLYSVGGKPVLVMWGHAAPGTVLSPWTPKAAPAPAATIVPPAAAPATPAGAAAVERLAASVASPPLPEPPAAPPSPVAGKPWKRWLAWGLPGLLLLALLLFGLERRTSGATRICSRPRSPKPRHATARSKTNCGASVPRG